VLPNLSDIIDGARYTGALLWYAPPVSTCFECIVSECLAESVIDPEKKKYFKIQPNHAIPSAAKHSKQAVDAQKAASKVRLPFLLRLEYLFSALGFNQRPISGTGVEQYWM